MLNDVAARTRFSAFLDESAPTVAILAGIDRPLLERYLAWLATQPVGHGAKEDAVTGVHLLLSAIRQHGWDDTLPYRGVLRRRHPRRPPRARAGSASTSWPRSKRRPTWTVGRTPTPG